MSHHRSILLIMVAFGLTASAGCNPPQLEADYVALDGTITQINTNRSSIHFRFHAEDSGEIREEEGIVEPETEILINGRLSKLTDIAEGDRAFAVWAIESFGPYSFNRALKIRINREQAG